MKKLIITIVAMATLNSSSHAQIDLATGAGSTTGVSQSFNETRGVAIHVLSASDIVLQSVTLHGFYSDPVGQDTAYVGVRIFDNSTFALLASSPYDTVSNVAGGSVTIPFAYTLVSGSTYMFSVFCGGPNPPTQNSAYLFIPTSFPYVENSGVLEIVHAAAYPADVFPANMNLGVPLITLGVAQTTGIAEGGSTEEPTIYPNPSNNGRFRLSSAGAQEIAHVRVLDAFGRTCLYRASPAKGHEFDLGALGKGLYHVVVRTDGGLSTTLKFIYD